MSFWDALSQYHETLWCLYQNANPTYLLTLSMILLKIKDILLIQVLTALFFKSNLCSLIEDVRC